MNFWEEHDRALIVLRYNAIKLIEEFERKHDTKDKNYNKRLNSFLKRKIGRETNLLTNLSITKTLSSVY